MPPLRALFVVPHGEWAPGPRYRVFQFLPGLSALGIHADVLVVHPEGRTTRRVPSVQSRRASRAAALASAWMLNQLAFLRVVRLAPRYDRIFIYRCPVPSWVRSSLGPRKDDILFDFDDALDQPELEGGPLQHWRVRVLRRGMENAVALSGLTITSNRRNASVVESLGGRALIVPTCVDLARAALRDRCRLTSPRPVLGWIGTPTTARYLAGIEDPLLRLSEARALTVRLIGAGRAPFDRLAADLRDWSLVTESEDVAAFDIGLMPMPDTPWTRGKAALKALQYGAAGMATVASWTATNAEILGEQEGTLLCRSGDEWLAALRRLLDDDAFRVELGERARRRVESDFALGVVLPKIHAAIVTVSRADS
jgi:glycosyltransferase involved in cell wall biosynthesis